MRAAVQHTAAGPLQLADVDEPGPREVLVRTAATLNWDRRIQGSVMGSNRFRIDIPRYVDLYLQGRLRLDDLISSRITLDELPGSIGTLHGGHATRTAVTF